MPQSKNQIITLPGWGFSSMSLQDIWPDSICLTCEELFSDHSTSPSLILKKKFSTLDRYQTTTIIGWSLGALVALEFCIKEKPTSTNLILISPTHNFHFNNVKNSTDLETLMLDFKTDKDNALRKFYFNLVGQNRSNLFKKFIKESAHFPTDPLARGLEFLNSTDLTSNLHTIENKCLIIHGENDNLIPIAHSQLINKNSGNSIFVSITNGTHMLPYENQSDIRKIIEDHEFLSN